MSCDVGFVKRAHYRDLYGKVKDYGRSRVDAQISRTTSKKSSPTLSSPSPPSNTSPSASSSRFVRRSENTAISSIFPKTIFDASGGIGRSARLIELAAVEPDALVRADDDVCVDDRGEDEGPGAWFTEPMALLGAGIDDGGSKGDGSPRDNGM